MTATVTIQGKIQWTDSEGNLHPVRNGWIELWEEDVLFDDLITGGATDENGEYEFTVPIEVGVTVEPYIYLRSDSFNYPFTVRDLTYWLENQVIVDSFTRLEDFGIPTGPNSYEVYSNVASLSYPSPPLTINIDIPNSDNKGKAFSILDAIYVGHQYGNLVLEEAEAFNAGQPFTPPPQLDILFPYYFESSSESSSYKYDPAFAYLHSLRIRPDDWENWDVLLHEFGHYLANIDKLGTNPTGSHIRGESGIHKTNAAGTYTTNKESAIQLAWNEGLADYLSLAIQHTAYNPDPELNLLPLGMPNVSESGKPDTYITSPTSFSINLETIFDQNQYNKNGFTFFIPQGEGDETSVSRILWDIADHTTVRETFGSGITDDVEIFASGAKDEIAIGHVELYKILDRDIAKGVAGNLYTLEDLWNYFYNNPTKITIEAPSLNTIYDDAKRAKIGAIFEEYSVSPVPTISWLSDTITLDTEPLSFEWRVGNNSGYPNGIPEKNNINDEFQIIIFDEYFSEEVFKSPILNRDNYGSSDGTQWTLLNNQTGIWNPSEDTWGDIVTNAGIYHVVITGSDKYNEYGNEYYSPNEQTGDVRPYWSGAYTFTVIEDRNGDGIDDNEQPNVVSLNPLNSNDYNDFITIATPDGINLLNVSVDETLPANSPQNVDFPLGVLNFDVITVTPAEATQVTVILPESININTYWKYDTNLGWTEFLYDGTTGAEFKDIDGDGDNDEIILHFVDGERGDSDGVANGVITDPGAPGMTQTPVNQPPILAANTGLTLAEGNTVAITNTILQVTDADNTATEITYTLTDLPDNGTLLLNQSNLVNNSTFTQDDIDNNRLTYTHNDSETSSDSFSFTVTDGANGNINQTLFNITINSLNDPPQLNNEIADQTATENQLFNFTIPTNTFSDPDEGDSLTYTATLENEDPLPSWLSFDGVTGTLSGTPAHQDVGLLNVKLTATDTDGANISDVFALNVADSINTYYVLTTLDTWAGAQAQAQALGGDLVTVNDAQELQLLLDTFGGSESFWIGLTDQDQEGVFRWVSGEPVTFTNWVLEEPNNWNNEDYTAMNQHFPGGWNDFNETTLLRGIVELTDPVLSLN